MIRIPKNLSTIFSYLVNKLKLRIPRLSNIFSGLLAYFRTSNCYLCDEKTHDSGYFCAPCYLDLPTLKTTCSKCSLPLTLETKESYIGTLLCGECIANPPHFEQTICVLEYQFPINQIIKSIKYSSQRYWTRPLTRLLINRIVCVSKHSDRFLWPELIVPIPIHKSKAKVRGYNQAELIAQGLSKSLRLPTSNKILIKTNSTETQARLNKQERMRNLEGSLAISSQQFKKFNLRGKHIALVDDVMTTKATCELASKLLLEAGARRVDVWCLARTPKRK